jgi:hypothetical protein
MERTMLRASERTSRAGVLALLGAALASGEARANPRPLPFTYQAETLPRGAVEVEQFVDVVPLRAVSFVTSDPIWFLATQFQTEFEVGLTDRLELGLYVDFVPQPSPEYAQQVPALLEGNGIKQRLRYHLGDPETWPVDVGLYGEVVENEREIELEAKIILQRRMGPLAVITNLWAEREFYFSGRHEWVVNPTLGATFELLPRVSFGLEGWLRAEYPDGQTGPRDFNLGPHVYVGPTFMASFGKLWWSTGAYLRVTDFDRTVAVGDATRAGDSFGHLWVRTIVGLSF